MGEIRSTTRRGRHPVWFLASLGSVVGVGAILRILHLSHGTLFRDDAWVALTSHVDFSTAWKMVGASPGYIIGMRQWIDIVGHTTWLQQLPTLVVSIASLLALGALARWWGLSRVSTILIVSVLAGSRIAVEYSTHLKPYSHDLVMASFLLFTAAKASRERNVWWFAGACVVSVTTSLTALPLVVGGAAVVLTRSMRQGTARHLVGPLVGVGLPLLVFAWVVQRGLSPRLHESWTSNFVDVSSIGGFVSSSTDIVRGLLWGLVDSTPRIGIPSLGGFVVLVFAVVVVIGSCQRGRSTLPVVGIACAYLAAVLGVIPLGTGRTDSYLYVPLLILFGLGLDTVMNRIRRGALRTISVGLVSIIPFVGLYDHIVYHQPYPGGDFRAVAAVISGTVRDGGNVIVEGTARWPYAYYSAKSLTLEFSPNYNTGFAPVVGSRHIVVMRGSQIEGGYDPAAAVNRAYGPPVILTVRASDWPTENPLASALIGSCYLRSTRSDVPGYILEWWTSRCQPD